jgi:phage recombination protein Bet
MNAVTKIENTALTTMSEAELSEVLQSSLYPGASLPSIKMVLGYCKAAGLDPLQKPVHIVPMNVKKPGTRDQYEWRDVIMPGVGLYRTQAARTGEHVGTDEPEFGPPLDFRIGDFVLSVPEWCKVTVYRMKNGMKSAFTATEYWTENYATAGRDSQMPNAMWKRRIRGQIAKCAEAQALRKGFPEVGSQPTAEEMEGKFIDEENGEIAPTARKPAVTMPQARAKAAPTRQDDPGEATDVTPKGEEPAAAREPPAPENSERCSAGEIAYITRKLAAHKVSIPDALVSVGMKPADTLDGLNKDGFTALKDEFK